MFQQMKYFLAVVDEHSFTRAADKCHISQSAISQQMKELKQNVGTSLLKRQGRSFELTPAGHYFYRQAQHILQEVDHTIAQTQQIAQGNQDEYVLRLGYLRMFGTTEFLHTVTKFSQRYPDVKVKITSGTHEQLFKLIREGQLDLNFSDQRRALSGDYHNEFLTRTALLVRVASGTFPAGQDKVDVNALAETPCILVADSAHADSEERYCRDVLGIRSDFITTANYDEAHLLVASRQGFLITNEQSQEHGPSSGTQLLKLYHDGMQMTQKYYAYWKKGNSGYYIEAFAEILKDQFQQK